MALNDTMQRLLDLAHAIAKDLIKVYRGNLSAAQRVRVGTLHLQKWGKLFRKESLRAEKRGALKRRRKNGRKKNSAPIQ